MDFSLDLINEAVEQHAAIRRIRRLQPVGGQGDRIFPPTYPGEGRNATPVHVFEQRRIDGESVDCVLLDSVQSQANRLEEALLAAAQADRFSMPVIAVSFAETPVADIGLITTLDAPHRVFDAILRDSQIGTVPFRQSQYGDRLQRANMRFATALFEVSPSALIFGAWNSTSEGGGLGAKFPRCLVSEVIGVGAVRGLRTGSRIDPLGAARAVAIFQVGSEWFLQEAEARAHFQEAGKSGQKVKPPKQVKPSEINHGNIAPSITPLGVTVNYALHTVVVTLAGLRRLSFPVEGQAASSRERDRAARSVLAALSMVAIIERDRMGYALRSRCDLVPDPDYPNTFELVRSDGTTAVLQVDADCAVGVLQEAVRQAESAGLAWSAEPIVLTPQPRLVELVRRSRELALAGETLAEDAV